MQQIDSRIESDASNNKYTSADITNITNDVVNRKPSSQWADVCNKNFAKFKSHLLRLTK